MSGAEAAAPLVEYIIVEYRSTLNAYTRARLAGGLTKLNWGSAGEQLIRPEETTFGCTVVVVVIEIVAHRLFVGRVFVGDYMVYTVLYIRVMRLNTRSLDLPYDDGDALNIRSPLNSFITFAKRISIHTGVYSYSTNFIQERRKDIFSFISLNCIQVVVSGLTLIYPSYLDSISCIRIPMTITLGK